MKSIVDDEVKGRLTVIFAVPPKDRRAGRGPMQRRKERPARNMPQHHWRLGARRQRGRLIAAIGEQPGDLGCRLPVWARACTPARRWRRFAKGLGEVFKVGTPR